MEPSDQTFARSYRFLDAHGENLDLGASLGGRSYYSRVSETEVPGSPSASFKPSRFYDRLHYDRTKQISNMSAMTRWSDNTLVQSVLLADGLIATDNEEELFQELPARYQKGDVKSTLIWFGALCLGGIGMFVEAYVIITTGQVKTVWHDNYPVCWDAHNDQTCPNLIQCCNLFPNTPQDLCSNGNVPPSSLCTGDDHEYPESLTCSTQQLGGVSYAEFAGIMCGMLSFGAIIDIIGRKRAGSLTSALMILGIGGMTYFDSSNASTLFMVFSAFFAIFGWGVGGEYPLSATHAAEHHAESAEDALWDDAERRHQRILMECAKTARRGETISLVFAMQGVGAVVGSMFLSSFIYFSNQGRSDCDGPSNNSKGVDPNALETIWRSFYFIGLIFVCMLFIYRFLVLEEGDGHVLLEARKEKREQKLGKDIVKERRRRVFSFYLPRLIGTGGNWLVANITFYGLKLFSGPIFKDINPAGNLVVQNGYLLINNLCALVGYYCAATVIDRPSVGRKNLQMYSFLASAIVFFVTAAIFDTGSSGVIMFLFFFQSFLNNFGANVTTYVMAAETYPTELRGTFHGLSAFFGKVGALSANLAFSYLSTKEIFWVCGGCSLVGVLFTYVFSVDLTGVSLSEHDAQLELIYAGHLHRYNGKLNARQHLSKFELWTGRHGEYKKDWAKKLVKSEARLSRANLITLSNVGEMEEAVDEAALEES